MIDVPRVLTSFIARKTYLSGKCNVMRIKTSPLFRIALVLVRFDHIACGIVNANHNIM